MSLERQTTYISVDISMFHTYVVAVRRVFSTAMHMRRMGELENTIQYSAYQDTERQRTFTAMLFHEPQYPCKSLEKDSTQRGLNGVSVVERLSPGRDRNNLCII